MILFGEQVSADVIKGLEMRTSLINWLRPKSNDKCLHKGPYAREGGDALTMEVETGMTPLQGTLRATKDGGGRKDSPFEPSERALAC